MNFTEDEDSQGSNAIPGYQGPPFIAYNTDGFGVFLRPKGHQRRKSGKRPKGADISGRLGYQEPTR
jgi:hypothetical protein